MMYCSHPKSTPISYHDAFHIGSKGHEVVVVLRCDNCGKTRNFIAQHYDVTRGGRFEGIPFKDVLMKED